VSASAASPTAAPPGAEAPLTAADFDAISRAVAEVAGIQLRAGKEGLVRARLARRLRELGDRSFHDYLERVRADGSRRELAHMVDLLTTNKTSFFREAAHFDLLRERVLPEFGGAPGGLRLWSAGCSSGEEAYTMAMVLRDALPDAAYAAARVLATDISARVLARARAGAYAEEQVADVPAELLRRHFTRDAAARGWAVGAALRAPVRFAPLNLMGAWPMAGPFHAIWCRNVMIYFDKPTQAALVARFEALLAPGGYLCVGHSESLSAVGHGLAYVQPAAYRKPA
jgi:chemotaxis protein methyltransferase CheR